MRVLVTGSTGLVGRQVLEDLGRAGMSAVGIVRQPGARPVPDALVIPSIDSRTDWHAALDGIDAVVHLAAHVHDMTAGRSGRTAVYHEVNALGTERLAAAAVEAGVRRFVLVSSIKAMGEGRSRPWTITDLPRPVDPYGQSKLEGERRLLAIASGTGMQPVIIRPPLVHGPGVKANFLAMMRWVSRGIPLPLGSVEGRRSLISVWNLSALLVECLQNPDAAGEIFLASDGSDLSVPELLRTIGSAMDRPVRLVDVPPAVLRLAARLPRLGPVVSRLTENLLVDPAHTFRRLDWAPPVTVEEGLRRTVQGFTTSGQAT